MQKSLSNRRTWLWLGTLLLLFVFLSYFLNSEEPKEYPGFVSESPSPTGTKAIYTYLEDEKSSVNRWSHEPGLLPSQEENQLLIMVEPAFISETEEMNEYEAFMEAGNTILLLKSNPDGMFDLNTEPLEVAPAEDTVIYDEAENEYDTNMNSLVRLQPNEEDEILLHDEVGTVAMKRSYGNGALIVANSPEWMTNEELLVKDHLPLTLNLLQGWDTILFDEYNHGSEHAPTLTTLYPKWLLVLGLQAILLTVIWLWHQGKRFGPIIAPTEDTVRFSNERIKALAAWYQRGRRYQDSLAIQADYVKLLLQERWGVPYRKDWLDIGGQLEQLSRRTTQQGVSAFLTGLKEILNKDHISKKEYLLWSKEIDRLREEVEGK